MRFIHTSDIHLGATPDVNMPWAKERSEAIWNTFTKLIHLAEEEQMDLLFIAGDLFHRQPLRRELKEINYLFSTLTYTRVVIIAGNHDYIQVKSPYVEYPWAENVTFLSASSLSSVYFEDINTEVHGLSYHRPEIHEPLYDSVTAPADGQIHVLLAHGGDAGHIPIGYSALANSGFHYVALGHIHQPKIFKNASMAYSGSLEPLDKSDLGNRGFVQGEVTLSDCQLEWIPFACARYLSLQVQSTRETTMAQIIDLLQPKISENTSDIYKIQLTGFRDPETNFDPDAIRRIGRIVDIIDKTEPEYDLEALIRDHSHDLISYYIRALSGDTATVIHRKALYYGLRALLNPDHG